MLMKKLALFSYLAAGVSEPTVIACYPVHSSIRLSVLEKKMAVWNDTAAPNGPPRWLRYTLNV
jgi:hypothetical protein